MKILHLFANHKFTGPADPALDLAALLRDRGHDVAVAVGRGRAASAGDDAPGGSGLLAVAKRRGLRTIDAVVLPKHGRPVAMVRAVRALRAHLRALPADLVHCHLPGDHFVAALAAAPLGTPVVRTYYDAEPPFGVRARFALAKSAGAFVFSAEAAARLARRAPALERSGRVRIIEPAIDFARFSPRRDAARRAAWSAGDRDVVCGVVARMQRHRLFGELIEGFAEAAKRDARLHLVVLGRGTHAETVARAPARNSAAAARIHFPGYVPPEEYPRVLPCFDLLIFLVPGSDGTCRAAREALACGVPVIASRRGLLPTFIRDGVSGALLPAETPAAIAAAISTLAGDDAGRAALARRAAEFARAHFDPERQAAAVLDLYRALAGAGVAP